jgi:hypothetical protein
VRVFTDLNVRPDISRQRDVRTFCDHRARMNLRLATYGWVKRRADQ